MFLFYLFVLALAVYFIFFVNQFYNIIFKGYAPFVSTDSLTIKTILEKIEPLAAGSIYELGCGRALFLKQAAKKFPQLALIGVENSLVIYLLTKLFLKLGRQRINLIRTNFFTINLSEATLIYCYLNNETMNQLGEKIIQECKPGTQIISRRFPIAKFKAKQVITINRQKIYFYTL